MREQTRASVTLAGPLRKPAASVLPKQVSLAVFDSGQSGQGPHQLPYAEGYVGKLAARAGGTHVMLYSDQHLGIFFEAALRLYELRQVRRRCCSGSE